MIDTDAVSADNPQKRRRYKRNTGAFRGVDLRTVRGRRVRQLYARYVEQTALDDDIVVHQSAALRLARLQVIVERLQNEALRCGKHNQQLGSGISSASSHTHSAVKPTRLGE
jgi:hypothetical protein